MNHSEREKIREKLASAAESYLNAENKDAVSFLIEIEKLTGEYYRIEHPELQG